MTGNDFRAKALIHIAAALVKVYDEKCDGIVDNEAAQNALAKNACDIAQALFKTALESGAFKFC
jgi:hypothetical protein